MTAVYDIPDLQDRIRKLRIQQQELKSTKDSLQAELEAKEKKLTVLRQELAVVAPNEAIRFQPDDNEENIIDEKKFLMMNEKLDMQILIQEIRNALPQLEQQAKAAEASARVYHKSINQSSKLFSHISENRSLLTKPVSELEELVNSSMDQLVRLRGDQAVRLEKVRQANQELSAKINKLRRELAKLYQERNALQKNLLVLETPALDRERLRILRQEHKEVRNRLQRFHNGYGWQVEAFKGITGGKKDEKVEVFPILGPLRAWLVVEKEGSNWCTEESIQRVLQNIVYGDEDNNAQSEFKQMEREEERDDMKESLREGGDGEEGEDELLIISDKKPSPTASRIEDKVSRRERVEVVDLSLFCQLCDRLCILFEN